MVTKTMLCAGAALLAVSSTRAAENVTLQYDALGRLTATMVSGGPRDGKQVGTVYDPAGNRTSHAVGPAAPPPPNNAVFSIAGPAAVDEGTASVFTISKSGPAYTYLSVAFATANGSAASPGDFSAASGTLVFRNWETIKTVSVATLVDGLGEGSETFSMQLSSPSAGAGLGTSSANGTINPSSPPNQHPVANPDFTSVGVCQTTTANVIANDSDPDGNVPLSLMAVGSSPGGEASVLNATTVAFTAAGAPGSFQVSYTVQDSLGAPAFGTLNVQINAGTGCQ